MGGIVGTLNIGIVDKTYNVGELSATTNVAQIKGFKTDNSSVTNSGGITQAEMIGWSQSEINSKLGSFTKKTNSLPILNIRIGNITSF